jgi:AcrR family transcriptional regulator
LTVEPRRRRSPEQAEAEILDAAERLLRSEPLAELTVSRVMRDTTLTRNAFYVYFRDRYDLVARLVDRLREGADASMAAFADEPGADPDVAGRAALRSAAQLYLDHGELLRALPTPPGATRAPRGRGGSSPLGPSAP